MSEEGAGRIDQRAGRPVAAPTRGELPERLRKRVLIRALASLVLTWVEIGCVWLACARWQSPAVWICGAVLVGTLQYHLNILAHDALHGSLCSERAVNDVIARWALLGPQGLPLSTMRYNHLRHHNRLGMADDADRQYYDLADKSTRPRLIAWLLGVFCGATFFDLLRKVFLGAPGAEHVAWPGRQDLASVLLTQMAIASTIWVVTGAWWGYLVLWALPICTVMLGLNSVRSCLEHVSADAAATPADRLYSFRSGRIEAFFLSPFNMNYHAEHHLYAGVPFYRLPELADYLQSGRHAEYEVYRSYAEKLRQLLAVLPSEAPARR